MIAALFVERGGVYKGWKLEAKKDWHRLRQQETQERWAVVRK